MDNLTLDRIKTAHPILREQLLAQYKEISAQLPAGVVLRFAYVFRSFAEQDALYKQVPKVTKAKGGQSIHNYGLAFDIVLIINGKASWAIDSNWLKVVNYFKSKGWEWGGDWKSFKDAPHFQKTFGYTWQECLALHNKGLLLEGKYPMIDPQKK